MDISIPSPPEGNRFLNDLVAALRRMALRFDLTRTATTTVLLQAQSGRVYRVSVIEAGDPPVPSLKFEKV